MFMEPTNGIEHISEVKKLNFLTKYIENPNSRQSYSYSGSNLVKKLHLGVYFYNSKADKFSTIPIYNKKQILSTNIARSI